MEIVRILLRNGADCSSVTKDTVMTPAHWAAYNKDADVCKELLRWGADPFVVSKMNRLPIDVAGSCKAEEVVDVFLNGFKEAEERKKANKLASRQNRGRSTLSVGGRS